jgi:thioester reductase-like protein
VKTVLVTGGTGAVGSVLAAQLLAEKETRVALLVRARSAEHLQERVRELVDFWALDPSDRSVMDRLIPLAGDVTRSQLGLEPGRYDRLVGELSHIVHAAANVKLDQTLEEARRAAVDSARNVLALARACRTNGRFRKLDVVSTIGVGGRFPGAVPERILHEPRAFHNTYEAAKAEAEELVWAEVQAGRLPGTIHRPSMVVGDSTTGRIIHFQVFYYLCEFLSGRRTAGFVPSGGGFALDIVPVDYVARAIQIASDRDDAAGRIFHLCSGPDQALPLGDLAGRVNEIFSSCDGRRVRLRRVPSSLIRAAVPVLRAMAPPRTRRALRSLPFLLSYLDERPRFDTTRTRPYFAAAGLTVPTPEQYLATVLRAYWTARHGGVTRPRAAS